MNIFKYIRNHKNFALLMQLCILSTLLLTTITFSWFTYQNFVNRNNFDPGILDPNLEVLYWNKQSSASDKWEDIEIEAGGQSLPLLGEMRDITQLPDDSSAYMKIRVHDNSGARFNYDVILDDIIMGITSINDGVDITDIIGDDVNYFDTDPSQKCFNYYYAIDIDGRTPSQLFSNPESLTATQISTRGQTLSGGSLIADTLWLYIMIVPRLAEIQNLILIIPVDYSPYQLCFIFHLRSEVRTLDTE